MQGGKYIEFMSRMTRPAFATALLVILYLTIGPMFAVPRTGAVSFEIGIRPFLAEDRMALGQFIYTALFFGATYWLALNPSKLIDRVGKMLTPALLVFLAILFLQAFASPLGEIMPATGPYAKAAFAQGFQDGYQTMDLLATIAIGTLVVNAVRERGVEGSKALGRVCLAAGLIALCLMTLVYGSLAYLGATSAQVLGHSANGGQLLAQAVGIFFGPAGNLLLAVIIGLACLTTSCGIISGTAWFFNRLPKNKIAYKNLLRFGVAFSFMVSNIGLTKIIALAMPFLVGIYPLVIVLVVLSLFQGFIGERRAVYRWAMDFTLVFAALEALKAAGLQLAGLNHFLADYVPFYNLMLGWLIPAAIGAGIGLALSFFRREATPIEEGNETVDVN